MLVLLCLLMRFFEKKKLSQMSRPVFTTWLTVFGVAISFATYAQNSSRSESHEKVLYDPLFWRAELNIKNDQSRRIEEINTEFYQNLRQINVEASSREVKNTRLEEGLQERSQKIFNTLLPKQRRKLEKIIDKTAPVTAP
jgi:hypothetical protein